MAKILKMLAIGHIAIHNLDLHTSARFLHKKKKNSTPYKSDVGILKNIFEGILANIKIKL